MIASSSALVSFDCYVVGELSLTRRCAEYLLQAGHRIIGLQSPDDRVLEWAQSTGIRTLAPTERVEQLAFASAEPFDYLFSIANGSIVPDEILALARKCAINFHDGPLPEYAGFFTPLQSILRREPSHGITWHIMERRLDAGAIVKQVQFPLAPDETCFTLNAKCYEAAIESFQEMIGELAAGTVRETSQDLTQRNYFGRYERPWCGCAIDFRRSSDDLDAFFRALDFGRYANAFGMPVLLAGSKAALVLKLSRGGETNAPPGTVVGVSPNGITIASLDREVILSNFLTMDGKPWPTEEAAFALALRTGGMVELPDESWADVATAFASTISRHEPFWVGRLKTLSPLQWPPQRSHVTAVPADGPGLNLAVSLPETEKGNRHKSGETRTIEFYCDHKVQAIAAMAAFLARCTGAGTFDAGFTSAIPKQTNQLFAEVVPIRFSVNDGETISSLRESVQKELVAIERANSYARSLLLRYPDVHAAFPSEPPSYPVVVDVGDRLSAIPPGSALLVSISQDGRFVRWIYDSGRCEESNMNAHAQRFKRMLDVEDPAMLVADPPFLGDSELSLVVEGFNQTAGEFDRHATIPSQFEAQVERSPNSTAVTFEGKSLTYRDLNSRANQLAAYLRKLGAGPESIVAISVRRSLELVVAMLGVLKAGSAYLPLDPAYPRNRIAFLLEDSGARLLITGEGGAEHLPAMDGVRVVAMDHDAQIDEQSTANCPIALLPSHLAYVIYTSGSTGTPKGVMVEHRNVINFFAGVDRELGTAPGVWLAVTSISFDISVLELFWTLTRGFHVVLMRENVALEGAITSGRKTIDFSLFYFGNTAGADDPYRLLLEGARYADANGFIAVWTPERHFHSFGGLYPNPAITSAALATITRKVQLRAGSLVVPLHHPARIAEEWALVDCLSNGRAAISLAPGWNERDFIFAPENYARAKQIMFESMDLVRALWRGEAVRFRDGKGVETEIRTFPRPVQKELPIWVTAAGNPETFRIAGSTGAHLLTHLLGQSIEQLASKIQIYRDARREAGHDPESGCVTVMLHTLAGQSTDEVREAVREPMKAYLRTSVDLIRNSPWSFPIFAKHTEAGATFDLNDLSTEEMEALLEHSFLRYFETSGLFGSVDRCVEIAHTFGEIGVDEIACLVDFGVPADRALQGLAFLNEVRQRCADSQAGEDFSLPAMMRRHAVTHFQCTPSMAGMIAATPGALAALRGLRHLLVGGEALTPSLAGTLRRQIAGTLHNMYGPTETTVWSTTHRFVDGDESTPIGRPMLNTQVYLLDSQRRPVAPGSTGELYIAGDGVTRGYLNRPDLTAERFSVDPFRGGKSRMYRTGDLASYRDNGIIDFHGRMDQQVKIRGYRIELSEIEAVLSSHPRVQEAAVVVRDTSLVAYIAGSTADVDEKDLRFWMAERLPDYMVPSAFIRLERLPLTPNGKTDRKSLPSTEVIHRKPAAGFRAPNSEMESTIATILGKVLGVDHIGADDNFFDLGAHSILLVQVRNQLQTALTVPLSLIALFQFPTVSGLAGHLSQTSPVGASFSDQAEERSKRRKDALALRGKLRGRGPSAER